MKINARATAVALVVVVGSLLGQPRLALATTGAGECDPNSPEQAGQFAQTGHFLIGARATIEGQVLTLCHDSGSLYPSGSFHWSAIANFDSINGLSIIQVGYGRCVRTDNDPMFGSTNCNGSLYWYWAWGGDCGSGVNGTGGTSGPIPVRIGSALSSPPNAMDYYVIRETVGGVQYYDGYVNGSLLQGTDALGNTRTARVAASSVCWNTLTTGRYMYWFGEVFNEQDSMGGWAANGTLNHLDHDSLQYTYNQGWTATGFTSGGPCDYETVPLVYSCTIAAGDHIYVDTISR
jgi:hypothetical protein